MFQGTLCPKYMYSLMYSQGEEIYTKYKFINPEAGKQFSTMVMTSQQQGRAPQLNTHMDGIHTHAKRPMV